MSVVVKDVVVESECTCESGCVIGEKSEEVVPVSRCTDEADF